MIQGAPINISYSCLRNVFLNFLFFHVIREHTLTFILDSSECLIAHIVQILLNLVSSGWTLLLLWLLLFLLLAYGVLDFPLLFSKLLKSLSLFGDVLWILPVVPITRFFIATAFLGVVDFAWSVDLALSLVHFLV